MMLKIILWDILLQYDISTCIIYICVCVSLYWHVHDGGSLLPKYSDCTTPIGFVLYLVFYGVMLRLLIIYIHTYI